MFPYIIIILLVVVSSFLDCVNINEKARVLIILGLLFILVLFAGTRFETGNDWTEYTKVFKQLPEADTMLSNPALFALFRMEPGYILFNSIVKSFGGTIDIVFFISALFTVFFLFGTFKHYSFFCFLAVLLYMRYGYLQTNTMFVRQGIAISIFFYSLRYIQNRNPVRYILLILIATSFHTSAILTLPFYFIVDRQYKTLTIVLLIIISVGLSFIDISKLLAVVLPNFIAQHITAYSESEVWGEMGGRFNFGLFEKMIIAGLCIIYRDRLNRIPNFNLFFNLFILSIICYFSFFQMYIFQQRLSMLLQISAIPVLISLVRLITRRQRIYPILLLSVFIAFFFLNFIHKSSNIYIPYKSWLF